MTRTEPMTTFPITICQMASGAETSVAPMAPRAGASMAPWWLGERYDTHMCVDCGKRFADEDIFYCHTCGRDLCPECVEILPETREVQCSKCAAASK